MSHLLSLWPATEPAIHETALTVAMFPALADERALGGRVKPGHMWPDDRAGHGE